MDCIRNEQGVSPADDKISNLFFRVVQNTAAVQGRVADQQQLLGIVDSLHIASQPHPSDSYRPSIRSIPRCRSSSSGRSDLAEPLITLSKPCPPTRPNFS